MQTAVARWRVSGRVQGVGFRWFVVQSARQCDVRGDVRNLRDGAVEVRAQGSREALDRLLEVIRVGPPVARVDRVETLTPDEQWSFADFDVRY